MKNQFASPDFLKIVQWNNVRFKVELGLDKKELNQQSICTNRFIEDSDLERFVLKKIWFFVPAESINLQIVLSIMTEDFR